MTFVPGDPRINRSGRPKGFAGVARMIMAETRDGAELVEWALCIWRDERLDIKDRMAAYQWLSDRGLGKPVQMTELAPPGGFTDEMDDRTDGYTLEELRELDAIEARRVARLLENRDQNPKVVDGGARLLPAAVAPAVTSTDEE